MYKLWKRLSRMDLYTLVTFDTYDDLCIEILCLMENNWEVVLNPKKTLDTCN